MHSFNEGGSDEGLPMMGLLVNEKLESFSDSQEEEEGGGWW